MVWVGIDGNEFVTGHMGEWQKIKNLQKDPRLALSLLGRGKNTMGLQEYLVVYGKARITEGGAAELLQRLARIYLVPDVEFLRNRSAANQASSRTSRRNATPESVPGSPGGARSAAHPSHVRW